MDREAICRNGTDYLGKFRFFHLMLISPNNPTCKQKNLECIIGTIFKAITTLMMTNLENVM